MQDPATDGVGTGLVGLSIAESLVWVGKDLVPQPQLLKSWEVSEDAREWTLHLQEGVTFNNGKPFNADDVIWNFQHWLDPHVGSSMATRLDFLSPSGIERVDELTVKLHLDRPNVNLLFALYDYPSMIAPEGGWEDFYSGDPADAIGTGPFLLESFNPDERMVLVRNPNYWQMGADGKPLPYVDKVIVTSGWDDAARLAALIGDQADILAPTEGAIAQLRRYPGKIDVQTYFTGWFTPIVARTDMPPFDDVRVRKALKLVQDRERIRRLVMPDGLVGYDHMIPPNDAAYCPATDVHRDRDIKQAKALLAEAGYPDGIELELALPDGDFRASFAQVYKEMAAEAGIRIDINILPSPAFWDQWMEWPFFVSGMSGRVPATANINLALRCGSDWNSSHYCNEELDALLDKVDAALDFEKRKELYCQIQTIIQEDSAYVIPFWAATFGASQSDVHQPSNWSRGGFLWHLMWLSN
jgi:peptide/nickel transport system substrate-binding protein